VKRALLPLTVAWLAAPAIADPRPLVDIVFVLDVSDSTFAPSGVDVDGDGETGILRTRKLWEVFSRQHVSNTDPDDSVLAAQVVAMKSFVEQLDPATTRVGLVAFSGDGVRPPARTVVPLTSHLAAFRDGIEALKERPPHGMTHMEAGVDLGAIELLGSKIAKSKRREGARRVMVLLSDGQPTLPLVDSNHENGELAIGAADQAAGFGIRIDTFGIGDQAHDDPHVLAEIARVSGGSFTPVRNLGDLGASFEKVDWFPDVALNEPAKEAP
jgi:hypothetical protein